MACEARRFVEERKTALNRLWSTLATLGILSAWSATVGCHKPALTPQEQEGKRLYTVRCAHCHEDNDLGLKKVPPDLHHVFAANTFPSGAPATDAEAGKVVLEGRAMMPSFAGRFTDEQMKALLAYLHTGLR